MKKSDILNYVKNANIANTKNYYHDSPSALSSDQLNEIVPENENNTIILGSLFSLIGFFMFLLIFSIRRFKAKKEIQRENFWAHHVEDVECFNIN
ncbi:hypothetical protein NBO_7g0041 [Nosema bombycis CQ1]|uniref:Uncharacterized protein n=1 Tax=Nosema bombycis (strain CQ1 / CVCC 102059) TaxID=578461 RepID=R0MQQ0_NOSB1|nr:hypothetical protein NBO_7g0041 [Nosema bombycis CQ1]|eukprot:EOB15223.1 hypothetical protein NBO_7g0041 [Nosema bombycis CQ1]